MHEAFNSDSESLTFLRRGIIREIPGLAQLVERRTVEGIHGMEYRRNPQVSGSNPEAGMDNLGQSIPCSRSVSF